MEKSTLVILLVTCFLVKPNCSKNDGCNSATTCGQCIRIPDCAWCSMTDFSNKSEHANFVRCSSRSKGWTTDCPSEFIVDPKSELFILGDEPLTTAKGVEDPTQLRPQMASLLNMRVGQVYNFTMQFKQAKDYPVDLYFLMDLSRSMSDDKDQLEKLGDKLAYTMRNMTRFFRLGFGSFVDKNIKPFAEYSDYSFWNQMPLGEDSNEFTRKVKQARVHIGGDDPEGGFEALLQVIVCKDEIGWRERARNIIVFATDNYSHLAGDGRFAGVTKPNDGGCHLDVNGKYTRALKQDYPSLGHISRLAKRHSKNLIFAVTRAQLSTYQAFSKLIEGSSADQLDSNSANIVTLVRKQYQLITSSVEMKDTASAGVKIRYYTSCLGDLLQENNKCDGLRVGSLVNFTVSIEITHCPQEKSKQKQTIQIYPVGLNETLTLDVGIVCQCKCENQKKTDSKSNLVQCSGGGDLECGICKCHEGRTGKNCECFVDDLERISQKDCRPEVTGDTVTSGLNSSSPAKAILCNGRGNCVCGKCECHRRANPNEIVEGQYCECDNFSCDRLDNKLCSGNGVCTCGQCICSYGWKGDACQCRDTIQSCIPIGGGDVCSGNGLCKCGTCECFENAKGRYCQDCSTCESKCLEFEECVRCKFFPSNSTVNMTDVSDDCDRQCAYSITRHENVVVEQTSERECFYLDDDNCQIRFIYGFGENGEKRVRVEEQRMCPQPLRVHVIGFGLMGALVAAGLIMLLIWKLATYVYDKKEYRRFLTDTQNAKWNTESNPLYVEASTTFNNPQFRKYE